MVCTPPARPATKSWCRTCWRTFLQEPSASPPPVSSNRPTSAAIRCRYSTLCAIAPTQRCRGRPRRGEGQRGLVATFAMRCSLRLVCVVAWQAPSLSPAPHRAFSSRRPSAPHYYVGLLLATSYKGFVCLFPKLPDPRRASGLSEARPLTPYLSSPRITGRHRPQRPRAHPLGWRRDRDAVFRAKGLLVDLCLSESHVVSRHTPPQAFLETTPRIARTRTSAQNSVPTRAPSLPTSQGAGCWVCGFFSQVTPLWRLARPKLVVLTDINHLDKSSSFPARSTQCTLTLLGAITSSCRPRAEACRSL
jgi:hypothetical protein